MRKFFEKKDTRVLANKSQLLEKRFKLYFLVVFDELFLDQDDPIDRNLRRTFAPFAKT